MSDTKRYEEDIAVCQECEEEIDFTEAQRFFKTADERFWHDDCYDSLKKLDRAEELREEILSLMVPEDCFDGLSSDFHDGLDNIQAELDGVIQRERLKADQEIGVHGNSSQSRYRGTDSDS